MTDFQNVLIKLNTNLNILREREAKYAGNAPQPRRPLAQI
jgi:hypothetical protein